MRSHLSECLEKGEFSLFPSIHASIKRKQTKSINYLGLLGTYCACRKPFFEENTEEDKENFMIVCWKCRQWYHKKCKRVHSRFFKDEKKEVLSKCAACK